MKFTIILAGLLASVATALPQAQPAACADAHILVARASGEAKGEGMIGGLSRAIKSAVKGTDSEAVDYPAALAPYGSSEVKGVAAAKAQLAAYVQRCPKAKVILMGYSQGADVMGSVLCGGGAHNSTKAIGRLPATNVNLGPETPPIEPAVGSHVVAAVLMGDPRFTKGMPFNKGTAQGTGQFPHEVPAQVACPTYSKRVVSYCDTDDEFCDSGKNVGPHLGYMGKYSTEAQAFVKAQLAKAAKAFPLPPDA